MRLSGGLENRLPDLVELPEESLAHHPRRASHHHVSVHIGLHNLPDQCLLSSIRKQSFPGTGSRPQRCVRNILSINCNLPLPWYETNPDFPGTRNPRQEEDSTTKDTKAAPAALDLAAPKR
jgi:hypothetical protein